MTELKPKGFRHSVYGGWSNGHQPIIERPGRRSPDRSTAAKSRDAVTSAGVVFDPVSAWISLLVVFLRHRETRLTGYLAERIGDD